MARPINAALLVSFFDPTGNPGEYTFEDASYNNQADRTGGGAYDARIGFALYIPSTDSNTGIAIPGAIHRYKLTSVTVSDPQLLSGTILWDEPGTEGTEVPTSGVGCLLCETSPNKKIGFAPSDVVYPELIKGSTVESVIVDNWNIVDTIGATGDGSAPFKTTIVDGVLTTFSVTHSLGTVDVSVQIFDVATGIDIYCGVSRPTTSSVSLNFTEAPPLTGYRIIIRK